MGCILPIRSIAQIVHGADASGTLPWDVRVVVRIPNSILLFAVVLMMVICSTKK